MNLLPALAPTSTFNIADCFTKPLPPTAHRSLLAIGDNPTTTTPPATSVPTATVDTASTVDTEPTVVASATTATTPSDSVPTLVPTIIHPNPVPYLIDTGASFPIAPASASDFIQASGFIQAPFGLIRSALLVVSNTKVPCKAYSTPVDPCTLITGEDTAFALSVDLSSTDSDLVEFASSIESFDIWEFGTATLVFISNPKLTTILVEPTVDWTDWFDWTPLPRLTPTESYFHIFGRDYLQAFALLHLIPIWIYSLVHFGLE